MRRVNLFLAASVFALGVAACSPASDPVAPTQPVSEGADALPTPASPYLALLNSEFVDGSGVEANLAPLEAALPAPFKLSWSEKSFNAESGATQFTNLSLSVEGETPFGIRFDTASIWGLEADLLVARLQGERLEEAGALFTRLEGEDMTYFGVAEAANAFIVNVTAEIPELEDFDPDLLNLESFEASLGKVVITDAALLPWVYVPLEAETLEALSDDERAFLMPALHFGQKAIAVTRSLSYGRAAARDAVTYFEMIQPGAEITGRSTVDLYGASGVSGFDFDQAITTGMETGQYTLYTEIESEQSDPFETFSANPFAGTAFEQSTKVEVSNIENFRLDKLFGHFAAGTLPEVSEKDLMGLGTWSLEGYEMALDDEQIFSAASVAADLSAWTWFIPNDINYDIKEARLDVANLGDFFSALIPSEFAAEDEDAALVLEGVNEAINLLPEYGLETISFDAEGALTWSEESGAASAGFNIRSEGNGDRLFDLTVDLPAYAAIVQAVESEDPQSAFEDAFEQSFAFKGVRLKETDLGGYDKIFGLAQAIGQNYPDEGWGAMLGNMTPEQMRMNIATTIRFGKTEVEQEFPPAADWLESLATYMQDGGAIEFKSEPPAPITVEMLDSLDDADSEEAFMGLFNISVTHTPN